MVQDREKDSPYWLSLLGLRMASTARGEVLFPLALAAAMAAAASDDDDVLCGELRSTGREVDMEATAEAEAAATAAADSAAE